jgi:DNA-binding NarL/FixJ family response regulator
LVDSFARSGTHYVVAERDERELDRRTALSPREYAARASAAAGQHDKLIAYELGLADSTVRVLLFRACRKLGATSRADGIARFRDMLARA